MIIIMTLNCIIQMNLIVSPNLNVRQWKSTRDNGVDSLHSVILGNQE